MGRILSHFSVFSYEAAFWHLEDDTRSQREAGALSALRDAADAVHFYRTFGTRPEGDWLVWSSLDASDADAPARFFQRFAEVLDPFRGELRLTHALWGFTRESAYSRGSEDRAIDSLRPRSRRYLVVYPFAKAHAWYATPKEERRRMMSEHIRVGRSHDGIEQQLLYCTGLQDHEFVVVYETDDLAGFEELVSDLRRTEARGYTAVDAPVHVGIRQGAAGDPE